jgi:hypothetical protein
VSALGQGQNAQGAGQDMSAALPEKIIELIDRYLRNLDAYKQTAIMKPSFDASLSIRFLKPWAGI